MAKRSRRRRERSPGKQSGEDVSQEEPTEEERSATDDESRRDRSEREQNSALEWVKSLAIALLLFLFLRTFIVQTFVITSGSMESTLLVGDMLVVNRLAIGSRVPVLGFRIPGYSSPRYGDVLVFDPPHEDTLMLIKRLVAMGGDTLEMRSRVLYRNGERVDEPYVKHANVVDDGDSRMLWQLDYLTDDIDPVAYRPTRDNWGPIVIPEGYYFMLGDNREASLDSRYWGLLEGWRLEGRAVFTYYSYNKESYRPFPWIREVRWGRIGDPIG